MKFLKVMLFILVSFNGWNVQAAPATQIIVQRITDLGGGGIRVEIGALFYPNGFVASTSTDIPASLSPTTSIVTPDVLAVVSGKFMTSLFQWSLFANNQDTSNYTRSVETYPISSQPWVIVSLSGATSSIPPVKTPKVSIFAVDPIAAETARDSGQFMIALNAPTTKNIRVKFSIEGKATKGRDYQRFAPSLLIPAGNVSGIIEVLPVDDVQREGTEKVTLKLLRQGIKGYTVKGRSVANVGILDND